MVQLFPYLGALPANAKAAIKAKRVIWLKVGEGTFTRREPYAATFSGQVSGIAGGGDFTMEIEILAPNEAATEGPARVALSGHSEITGTYRVEGDSLVLEGTTASGTTRKITLKPQDGGVLISGDVPATVKIVPA